MAIHEVARQGFDGEIYERSRPGYPPEVLDWLVDRLRLGPGVAALDLAAGTGKLTRLLATTGAAVVAAEPVLEMARVLRRELSAVPLVAAVAEALPFADGSFDGVTVAQAFHWFDRQAAGRELARVLRPEGRLATVWNVRDRSIDWADRVWSIMDRVEKRAPWRDHERIREIGEKPLAGFQGPHQASFYHTQTVTPEDVVARIASVSHVAVLEPQDRDEVLAEVRRVLGTHPDTRGSRRLELGYRVDAFWYQRE